VPFEDFRVFPTGLWAKSELFDVDRPVALELEVTKVMCQGAAITGPVFVFKDDDMRFPLVDSVCNSRTKALVALEASEETVFARVLTGFAKRIPPAIVKDTPVPKNSFQAV
jgi:3-polyprenyl-4-hydroxybenzoate decarboxylase